VELGFFSPRAEAGSPFAARMIANRVAGSPRPSCSRLRSHRRQYALGLRHNVPCSAAAPTANNLSQDSLVPIQHSGGRYAFFTWTSYRRVPPTPRRVYSSAGTDWPYVNWRARGRTPSASRQTFSASRMSAPVMGSGSFPSCLREDRTGCPNVAIISTTYWCADPFGGNPRLLTIVLHTLARRSPYSHVRHASPSALRFSIRRREPGAVITRRSKWSADHPVEGRGPSPPLPASVFGRWKRRNVSGNKQAPIWPAHIKYAAAHPCDALAAKPDVVAGRSVG